MGNTLYVNGGSGNNVAAYDVCAGTSLGTIDFSPDNANSNWELFQGLDGNMYTLPTTNGSKVQLPA